MHTNQSIERTTERAGLNRKSASRMIENARLKGKEAKEFAKPERRYLENKESEDKKALIYAGYCFIFNKEGLCITMFDVPTWFGKTMFKGKEQIQDPKIFYKKYAYLADE